MISAAQVLVVLLVAVSVVMLLYWRRRRHSSNGTRYTQTGDGQIEAAAPVAAMREAATVTSQENAEEEVHEPEGADQGVGDLKLRAESAGDERHLLDESPKEEALGEERQLGDAGTLANADESPEPDSRSSVSGPNTGSYRDTSAPADSLRDGRVTPSRQPITISEEERPAPDSAELRVERTPPALDSDDETRQLHNLPVRTSVRPAEHEILEP